MARYKTMLMAPIAAVGVMSLAACGGAGAAGGDDETVTLKVASPLSTKMDASVNGTQFFMDTVEELSEGQVKFDYYPAEQLGKATDHPMLAQSGAADLAMMGPSYTPDKFPLSAAAELPASYSSACEGARASMEMTMEGGFLDVNEYQPQGLRVVWTTMTTPYEAMTGSKEIDGVDSLKGLTMKSAGGAAADTAQALGMTPVQITAAETYTSLERGTVDGQFGGFESVFPGSLDTVLKNSTVGANLTGFTIAMVVSDKTWESLDEDVQDVLTEAGEMTSENFCASSDENSVAAREKLEKEHGWTMHELTDEERAEIETLVGPVKDQWAASIDESHDGLGSEAIDAWEAAISSASDAS